MTFCHTCQVDPSGRYDDLVTIRSFVPHYHLAGGVNLPKIIDCVGSDGTKRKQLVKVGGVTRPSSCAVHHSVLSPQFFSTLVGLSLIVNPVFVSASRGTFS